MLRDPIFVLVMDVALYAVLFFMLISTSSMFEFHMIIVVVVMFNILKLIMKILPNYTTMLPVLLQ